MTIPKVFPTIVVDLYPYYRPQTKLREGNVFTGVDRGWTEGCGNKGVWTVGCGRGCTTLHPPPTPQWRPLQWAVHILLECIFVLFADEPQKWYVCLVSKSGYGGRYCWHLRFEGHEASLSWPTQKVRLVSLRSTKGTITKCDHCRWIYHSWFDK